MNIAKLKIIAKKIAQRHSLRLVVLFGSAARGKTHRESDIDIAILPKNRLPYREEAQIEMDFQQALKRAKVEIVNLRDSTSPLLRYAIATDGKVLFQESGDLFDEFQIFAVHLYHEARPLFDLEKAYVKKHLAQYA